MLTAEGCAARRERLWGALPTSCDALIVAAPEHLIYFANYVPSPFVFRTVESGVLLLLEPGRATLLADNLLVPFLDRAFADEVVAPVWYDGTRSTPDRRGLLVASALDRLASSRPRRVGVEKSSVPSGLLEGLRAADPAIKVVDLGPVIRPLRRSKDPDEIEILRRSMLAGEAAQAAALTLVQPGLTEFDVYLIVQ